MATEVGKDRLSDLPDAMLVSILSLLPLDEAARCTVLATRWRRLFSPTLLLDFDANIPGRSDIIATVNSILAAHPTAPVRSFRASWRYVPHEKDLSSGGWLRELGRRGLEDLLLDFDFHDWHRIPASLFDCSSLKRLRASKCTFPDVPKAGAVLHLTRLTEIELCRVSISDDTLNTLLSQCTALERIKIEGASRFKRVHVRSPSLKIFDSDDTFDELFIDYAPNLEWLFSEDMYMEGSELRIKIAHAPKLKYLGYLGMEIRTIEIGETIFTKKHINVKTVMLSLKTLAIEVSYTQKGYIDWIIQLLSVFPCLETLYIMSDTWSKFQAAAPETWDVLRRIPCVHNHLEKVVFEVHRGHEWQVEMAKFLHGRSRFLKDMEFHCICLRDDVDDDEDDYYDDDDGDYYDDEDDYYYNDDDDDYYDYNNNDDDYYYDDNNNDDVGDGDGDAKLPDVDVEWVGKQQGDDENYDDDDGGGDGDGDGDAKLPNVEWVRKQEEQDDDGDDDDDDDAAATAAELPNVEWVRKQQELLCLDSRASKDARFLFFSGMLDCNWDICHDEWYKSK